MSRSCRLSWWSFPVLPLSARLPWISLRVFLLKTFAVALVLKARSWPKHVTFLLNYVRVLFRRSHKTFHLGFCGAGFWPWFSPWPFARTFLPFSDSCLKVDSFVFSPALHRRPLRSLVQRLLFTTDVSIFSSRRFLVDIALLSNSVTWCHYRCASWICFSPLLLAPFCPGLVRNLGGAGFVPRCVATASLGLFGTRLLPTSSLAVHQRVTSHLRWICLFYSSVNNCRNKWCSYLVRTPFS